MKLINKIAFPQIFIVISLGLISFIVLNISFANIRDQYIHDIVDKNVGSVARQVDSTSQQSIEESSLFVELPVVQEAYRLALSGDIDDPNSPQSQQAREMLRKELQPMLDGYEAATGTRLKLHFHLPNNRSLVRLWRDKNTSVDGTDVDISDDVSEFRQTVVETNATGNISSGIESGVGGFTVRGVIPITAPDGTHLGSAEVLKEFDPILTALNQDFALYANAELIGYAADMHNQDEYPHMGDFVQIVSMDDTDIAGHITPALLEAARTDTVYENFGNDTMAAFPLHDFQGKQAGVFVLFVNTKDIYSLATGAYIILGIVMAGLVSASIFALITRMRKLVRRPLGKMKDMIQDITEDRADLNTQIPAEQNDEIGELARCFNALVVKLSGIMDEYKLMSNQISLEADRYETMAHWYSSILDSIPMPVSVQSTGKEWLFINSAMENLLGKKRDDVIGLICCDNAEFDTCNTDHCAASCLKRGVNQTYFVYEGLSYQVQVSELNNIHGEFSGYIEVIQDITQLEQLRAVAEAESKAKSNFLSTMSHEMRTPLNAIIGMTTIGKKSDQRSRKDYALERIGESSSHLLGVINDILDMSKIEANKLELSPVKFRLNELLQKVMSVIGYRILEKHQNFKIKVDDAVPDCLIGDDQRLTQIIINLMTNAIKFTPEGGKIRLNIEVVSVAGLSAACEPASTTASAPLANSKADELYEIKFTVDDNGIGIPMDEKQKLFAAFSQAGTGISRKFGGTGLGLAISKSLIEMMDGHIWVESVVGEGSSFMFTVKMPSCDDESNLTDLDTETFNQTNNEFMGKQLLLAEDVDINREIVISLLEDSGIKIDCVENGADAVLSVADAPGKYDIVFMDVQMPVMDGLEATRRIRNIPLTSCKNIPIIALTANVFKDDIQNCLAAGMNDHLAKPIDINTMQKILRKHLCA